MIRPYRKFESFLARARVLQGFSHSQGRTLPFNTCPLIDRFLEAIAREQTDRFRPLEHMASRFAPFIVTKIRIPKADAWTDEDQIAGTIPCPHSLR
jgi:hypothetical protein